MSIPRSNRMSKMMQRMASSESLAHFTGIHQRSAVESLNDDDYAQDEQLASYDLKDYVLYSAYNMIMDAVIFFTKDGEAAYDELIGILSDPEVKDRLIRDLSKKFNAWKTAEIDEDEEGIRRITDRRTYRRAFDRRERLRTELADMEVEVPRLHDELEESCPGLLSDFDEQEEYLASKVEEDTEE